MSWMKKIDILVIRSFIGPFILTTCVVVFIFLMRFLMLYFNDFVGKDLGYDVFGKLFVYFSLITVPIALPLSVLLASLMCFGNLGEYTEFSKSIASRKVWARHLHQVQRVLKVFRKNRRYKVSVAMRHQSLVYIYRWFKSYFICKYTRYDWFFCGKSGGNFVI